MFDLGYKCCYKNMSDEKWNYKKFILDQTKYFMGNKEFLFLKIKYCQLKELKTTSNVTVSLMTTSRHLSGSRFAKPNKCLYNFLKTGDIWHAAEPAKFILKQQFLLST